MSLKDKTSIYQPLTPKTRKAGSAFGNLLNQAIVVKNASQTGKSPNSDLLPQATNIKSNFVEGNPTSTKFSQTVSVNSVSPTFHKSSLPPRDKGTSNNFVQGDRRSNKILQGTTVRSNSPIGNPSTGKTNQTNNAFFNVGKASQFSTSGDFINSFSGKKVSSGATVPPTFTFMELFFQRVGNSGGTEENTTPINTFFTKINTVEV